MNFASNAVTPAGGTANILTSPPSGESICDELDQTFDCSIVLNTGSPERTVTSGFVTTIAPVDSDGDGVSDSIDNCLTESNPTQFDSNGDGYGNRCDADFNNDCVVNVIDLGLMRTQFFTDADDQDLNEDGVVNVIDPGLLRTLFFQPPGPAANGSCP